MIVACSAYTPRVDGCSAADYVLDSRPWSCCLSLEGIEVAIVIVLNLYIIMGCARGTRC